MADEKKEEGQDAPEQTTGLGYGTAATGSPVPGGTGGTTLGDAPTAPPSDSTDTDTGLSIGLGQSTSTGTLPTQGGPNLDSPIELDTDFGPEHAPHGHTTDQVNDPRSHDEQKSRHSPEDE